MCYSAFTIELRINTETPTDPFSDINFLDKEGGVPTAEPTNQYTFPTVSPTPSPESTRSTPTATLVTFQLVI